MGRASSPSSLAISQEGRELLNLCRAGRLYDIEEWIAAGNPPDIPVAKRKTLLQVVTTAYKKSSATGSKM
jgi:hypothetical protein